MAETTMSSTEVCRVCANGLPSGELPPEFADVADIYYRFTALEPPEEKFSDRICQDCYDKLLLFDEFRKMCLAAYYQLSSKKETFDPIVPLVLIKEEVQNNTTSDPRPNEEINSGTTVPVKAEPHDDTTEPHDDITESDNANDDDDDSVKSEHLSEDEKPKKKRKKKVARKPKEERTQMEKIHCDQCDKFFYNKPRYEAHMREHQGLKPATCEICNKGFAKFTYLKMHMTLVHAENKQRHECDVEGCDHTFASPWGLVSHKKAKHLGTPVPKRQHVCEYCGKVFKNGSVLSVHRDKHEGVKRHACTLCGRSHDSASKLREHMRRHEGIKLFQCTVCGIKTVTRAQLRIHMNRHTKEKEYRCHICNSMFNSSGNKSRHIKLVHNNEKKFQCTYCDRAFGKSETLKHHVMIHTGEKPNVCTICGKRFIQLIAMQKHMKTHNK